MRIAASTFIAAIGALATTALPAYAQVSGGQPAGGQPAGGAALDQIAIATGAAIVFTTALLVLGLGHRSGRVALLGRWAGFSERVSGLPGWAALPSGIATVSLITAVFGMYWDISLHIDVGRDPGPLANPAHYFILAGLFGIFAAGFTAMVLPTKRPGPTAVRVAPGWHAPLGGILICACGAFALIGFPLDDVWHRLFGQDVTLWGPTHLMLIGGASMTLIGIAVLLVEGLRANRAAGDAQRELAWIARTRLVALSGGLLLGLSTFQAEFDFGVPQFRFVFQPMLIMLAAGVGLVAVRLWAGRGAALGAVAFFLVVRGGLALLVGPVLGQATPHFPLYIVEALVVEAVALRIPRERPVAFGLWAGVGIGTLGLAAEWAWSHVWMPLPWPSTLLPEAAIMGFAMAVAGALVGAWIGTRLAIDLKPRLPFPRAAAVAGAVVIAGLISLSLYKPVHGTDRAIVALRDAGGGGQRMVNATVRIDPPQAAKGAEWLTATSWQGGGLVVDRLAPTGAPGVYRTTQALPVYGSWKTTIRMHHGTSLTAIPVYMPDDPAIPAKGIPAPARFERTFVADHKLLQREQKVAAPALTVIASGAVLAIALSLLALLAWGLHRLSAPPAGQPRRRSRLASLGRRGRPGRVQPAAKRGSLA